MLTPHNRQRRGSCSSFATEALCWSVCPWRCQLLWPYTVRIFGIIHNEFSGFQTCQIVYTFKCDTSRASIVELLHKTCFLKVLLSWRHDSLTFSVSALPVTLPFTNLLSHCQPAFVSNSTGCALLAIHKCLSMSQLCLLPCPSQCSVLLAGQSL